MKREKGKKNNIPIKLIHTRKKNGTTITNGNYNEIGWCWYQKHLIFSRHFFVTILYSLYIIWINRICHFTWQDEDNTNAMAMKWIKTFLTFGFMYLCVYIYFARIISRWLKKYIYCVYYVRSMVQVKHSKKSNCALEPRKHVQFLQN